MFGLDPVWSIILISSFSNFLVDLFGEVFFEYTAVYLKDWMLADASMLRAACANLALPASFADAVNAAQWMSPAQLECLSEFHHVTYQMGVGELR